MYENRKEKGRKYILFSICKVERSNKIDLFKVHSFVIDQEKVRSCCHSDFAMSIHCTAAERGFSVCFLAIYTFIFNLKRAPGIKCFNWSIN